ncbi:hypothetical protein [Herbaspirillum frisingense]|uniref:hypothetical protein n=1 Tax=Herbaspirillum frisingense TaxID=92645 RepID=UPI001F3D6079|nr:hypothetical protein [Herbaspirillum frisingense]UIN22427.1 hypothetical protein LAZ82_04770 [Herbaspirillum frisingense]
MKHIALAAVIVLNGCATQPDGSQSSAAAPTPAPSTSLVAPVAAAKPAADAVAAAPAPAPTAAPMAAAGESVQEIKVGVAYTTKFTNGSYLKEVPEEVFIVRPKNTQNNVAAQVALNMFMFALGGGMAVNGFDKGDLKGDKLEDVKDRKHVRNPVSTDYIGKLSKEINAALQARAELKPGAYKNSVMVAGGSSTLIYESLTGDEANLYKMNTELTVYKRKEDAGLFTISPFVEVSCNRVSEKALPLEDWAKDDYVMVQQWVDETLDQCSKKVVGALPDLLAS